MCNADLSRVVFYMTGGAFVFDLVVSLGGTGWFRVVGGGFPWVGYELAQTWMSVSLKGTFLDQPRA